MTSLSISEAFRRYGATQRNVQWSVCAWNAQRELVVCMWQHHHRRTIPTTMEFSDLLSRWSGPGNNELRKNLDEAFRRRSRLRLIIARLLDSKDMQKVQAGEDPGPCPKEYFVRNDLFGDVISIEGDEYVVRFAKVMEVDRFDHQ